MTISTILCATVRRSWRASLGFGEWKARYTVDCSYDANASCKHCWKNSFEASSRDIAADLQEKVPEKSETLALRTMYGFMLLAETSNTEGMPSLFLIKVG